MKTGSRFCATEQDLASVAEIIKRELKEAGIILLRGQMGSGKTSFVRYFCKALGCEDEVSSPTFSLVNQYRAPDGKPIYHFDCYRMRTVSEAYDVGMEEYLWSGAWCLIEWPDIIEDLLPPRCAEIRLEVSGLGRTVNWSVPYP